MNGYVTPPEPPRTVAFNHVLGAHTSEPCPVDEATRVVFAPDEIDAELMRGVVDAAGVVARARVKMYDDDVDTAISIDALTRVEVAAGDWIEQSVVDAEFNEVTSPAKTLTPPNWK